MPDKTGAPHSGAALLRRTSVLPQAKPWRRGNSLAPSISNSPGIPKKEALALQVLLFLEATPRLELGVELLQSSALPLGYVALWITGARRLLLLSFVWSR